MRRLRTPAYRAAPPPPAKPLAADPSPLLVAHFTRVWQDSMHDMPFVNSALQVEAVGFRRYEGDWLGAVVTPWFINLFLLPGGGSLWQDLPTGQQRTLEFPVGQLDFIGDNNPLPDAALAAYQYCPLLHSVQHLPDQSTARQAAESALLALMAPPPADAGAEPASDSVPEAAPARPSRRAFLGGRAARRNTS
jgi:[NiFe] hydrogenase assembly HybE family chaperone